jgi:hypothetical protein
LSLGTALAVANAADDAYARAITKADNLVGIFAALAAYRAKVEADAAVSRLIIRHFRFKTNNVKWFDASFAGFEFFDSRTHIKALKPDEISFTINFKNEITIIITHAF